MPITSRHTLILLLVLFMLANVAYLHRVPGLMGDEAGEGENVYEKIAAFSEIKQGGTSESESQIHVLLQGERSYIGPLIDYVRLPFILLIKDQVLALRAPIFIISILTFIISAKVFRKIFNNETALLILAFTFFSPIYLTQQRLGWAIALFPFFSMLILWIWLSKFPGRNFLLGLVAGLALHNHILFLPTLAALTTVGTILELSKHDRVKRLVSYWPSVIGFVIAFSTQWLVLRSDTADQGEPSTVASLFWERVHDLPSIIPLALSGSSYVARYTGSEFRPWAIYTILSVVIILIVLSGTISRYRRAAHFWALGLVIHLTVLLIMIDRFTLRYFVIFTLGTWVLASVGGAALIEKAAVRLRQSGLLQFKAIGVSTFFIFLSTWLVLIPFLKTGGSVASFSLGNRTNSAADLAALEPLITCLRGQRTVSSENVHIYNRLQFLSHQYPDLQFLPEDQLEQANLLVYYRDPIAAIPVDRQPCPDLTNFIVERHDR